MADKLYFGAPGNIQEIPYPLTGMTFDNSVDTEVTSLVSGGRSIYRAPTAFQRRVMNWRSSSAKLAHLIDMYNGQFGPGPFYFSDPNASELNVLPPRWSNCWQLAHLANGWARPIVDSDDGWPLTASYTTAQTDRYVKFTQAVSGSTVKLEKVVRTRLIRVPGKAYYLAASGTATGGSGIRVRGLNSTSGNWDLIGTFTTFTGVPQLQISAGNSTYTMIELDLYLPLGSTLTLKGMALSNIAYTGTNTLWMPRGTGLGPVQFDNDAGRELVSTVIDRVGLSLSVTEVQTIESGML